MITKAYIHEYGNGKMEEEHEDVSSVLKSRNIEHTLFTTKRLNRNQLQLDDKTLVVGNHPVMDSVFKRIGFENKINCYPISLRPHLKREVWETTIGRFLMQSYDEINLNVFIKPKLSNKAFTGFVVNSPQQLFSLENFSKNMELYCSQVVHFISEYRVFVNKSKIVGMKNYYGNSELKPDISFIKNTISDFENSSDKTSAYGIDFGILQNNETALVEWNDAYSLGSYNLNKEVYTNLIITRWEEILSQSF